MRVLFNHGLSTGELFTNTPKRVCDKRHIWFTNNYGGSRNLSDSLGQIFDYTFKVIFEVMLNEKKRFKIPFHDAYFDFEIVLENDFMKQRQNGRFQEIDFIGSDFTGYGIKYFYRAKSYHKEFKVYLGGNFKKIFLEKINNGERFYSIRDFDLNDILPIVHKKYDLLTKTELRKILSHGFRRMYSAMKYGCFLSINSKRHDVLVHIGEISANPVKQVNTYRLRRDKKLRKIMGWAKPEYDTYYYIGLNNEKMKEWIEDNKKQRVHSIFKNVIARKIPEELYYRYPEVYIFRIEVPKFSSWTMWFDELKVRNIHYMGKSTRHSFKKSDLTWKQLIKEYEKGNT